MIRRSRCVKVAQSLFLTMLYIVDDRLYLESLESLYRHVFSSFFGDSASPIGALRRLVDDIHFLIQQETAMRTN